jgi:PAS domain S-box-containing protein
MGLFLCDFRTAGFLQVNRRFCEMFGYSQEEILGLTILDLLDPAEHPVVTKRSRQKRDGLLSESSSYVYTGIRKDGSRFRVNMTAAWVPYEGTQVMQGMAMDYRRPSGWNPAHPGPEAGGGGHPGERHRPRLQQPPHGHPGEHLAGHDGHAARDVHRTRLESIEQYVRRGTDLTRQLLGFAHGGTYEIRVTDLRSFIEKSSEMFGRARKEICIHRSFDDGLWPAEVDQGQLEQVLLNLYVNAWHAMPGGGDLYLCAHNVELEQDRMTPYHVPAGRFVKVEVRDTGVGMDKATMGRIFEPFFTTGSGAWHRLGWHRCTTS